MNYHLTTEEEMQEICKWHYPLEYSVYDLPTIEEQKNNHAGFYSELPNDNFYSFFQDETLIGMARVKKIDTAIELGFSVHPDMLGRGYGKKIVKLILELLEDTSKDEPIILMVRSWNKRAINCYKSSGFVIVGEPKMVNVRSVLVEYLIMKYQK